MQNLQITLGLILALGLATLWIRQLRAKQLRNAAQGKDFLFRDVSNLFTNPEITKGEAAGGWKLTGRYGSDIFQIQTVVDTLATRKLPILWVMVTLPKLQDTATYDFMMRPSGPTSFSNFDFLPHSLKLPADFPDHCILRGDSLEPPAMDVLQRAKAALNDIKVKEVLHAPKGRRIVFMAAQADRARYGVMREANFGDHVIDAGQVEKMLGLLL